MERESPVCNGLETLRGYSGEQLERLDTFARDSVA